MYIYPSLQATGAEIEEAQNNAKLSSVQKIKRQRAPEKKYICNVPGCTYTRPIGRIQRYHFQKVHNMTLNESAAQFKDLKDDNNITEGEVTATSISNAFEKFRNSPEGGKFIPLEIRNTKRGFELAENLRKERNRLERMLILAFGRGSFRVSRMYTNLLQMYL